MPEMIDSNVYYIGEIPSDYKLTKYKYHAVSRMGETLLASETQEEVDEDHSVPVYSATQDDSIFGYVKKANVVLKKGDLVIPARGNSIGCASYVESEIATCTQTTICSQHIHNIDNKYLYYCNWAFKDEWYRYDGAAIPQITVFQVNNNKLPYPTYSKQRKIADFLDVKCSEIDALSADIQAEIDTLEEYKRSVVFEAVCRGVNKNVSMKSTESDVWSEIPNDWELKDIKYLFEIVKRIAGKEGFDVLSVTQKGLKVKDIESGDGQLADSYAGYQFVYPTDYVMNHMDLLTGWVDLSNFFGVTSPDYRVFRLIDKVNNNLDYYKYVMQCCYMNKIFYSLGQGVSNLGRWRLQTSSFNNFKVPVPPSDEQKRIADYLNNVIEETNRIIDTKKEQLATLDEYKKSVIYEYVTGKKEVPNA